MSKIFLTEDQIGKLLRIAREASIRDYVMIHVALATGLRAGDLLRLKRCDVAPNGAVSGTVKIRMQKTKKMIERNLSSACQEAIALYLSGRRDGNPYLFRSESYNSMDRNGPMNRASLHRIMKRYLGLLFSGEAIKGNACHVTRRSMANIIAQRAGSILVASRFLGHQSLASTTAYLDADEAGKKADSIVQGLPWNTNP